MPADQPVVLVGSGTHGIRITAANGRARALGAYPGMALSDARAGIASLSVHQAQPRHDLALLMRLGRWAGRYGPARNRLGSDGLWIDIRGVAHLFGGEGGLLADLVSRLAASGLTARVGLADTLGAAWALARHGVRQSCPKATPGSENARGVPPHTCSQGERAAVSSSIAPPRGQREALAGLPVAALRLDEAALTLLGRLGLTRVGQLYGLPRASLDRRFREVGKKNVVLPAQAAAAVLMRLDQALGLAAEPLKPLGEPPVLSVRNTYPEPLVTASWLKSEIERLAGELASALQDASLGARRIHLTLHRADGTAAEAYVGFSMACRDGGHMARLLTERLEAIDAGLGIDVLVLDAVSVERHEAVAAVLAVRDQAGMRTDPALLVDRLVNRLGPERVTTLRPRASHLPERAQMRVPASDGTRPQACSWPADLTSVARRPPFLLGRPEPISVTAEIPEGPPVRFTWRRVMRRVRKAEGPERLAPEWWRELERIAPRRMPAAVPTGLERDEQSRGLDRPRPSRPRDYYRIEDGGGGRYWVFREGLYGELDEVDAPQWFLHGLFP